MIFLLLLLLLFVDDDDDNSIDDILDDSSPLLEELPSGRLSSLSLSYHDFFVFPSLPLPPPPPPPPGGRVAIAALFVVVECRFIIIPFPFEDWILPNSGPMTPDDGDYCILLLRPYSVSVREKMRVERRCGKYQMYDTKK
jgi:hypothetical protein